jgi:hypothetical protein
MLSNNIARKWPSLLFPLFAVLYVFAWIAVRRAALSGHHVIATLVVAFLVSLVLPVVGIV